MTTKLFHGDCIDLMTQITDRSIDLIAADLPYGTTKSKWDSCIPLDLLWSHYRRIIKPGCPIVLTASQPFTSALVMSNPRWFRYEWIWEKDKASGFLDARRKPLKSHESVLVFCDAAPPYKPQGVLDVCPPVVKKKTGSTLYGTHDREYLKSQRNFPRSVIRFIAVHNSQRRLHPTQKPVELFEYLIQTYTAVGNTILDNTMGSGTTGVACVNTGRNFIGIERDATFFQIAKERVEKQLQNQLEVAA